MFSPVFKIMRALLCAAALALIGVGPHGARAEMDGREARVEWDAVKRAKYASVIAARSGAACPVALALAQTGASRAQAPTAACEVFSRFFAEASGETKAVPTHREAGRKTRWRARSGVVRLLI